MLLLEVVARLTSSLREYSVFNPAPKPQMKATLPLVPEAGYKEKLALPIQKLTPSQGLIELPSGVVDKSDQIAQNCPRGINAKKLSEFYITGRGNLPPSPLNPLEGTVELSQLATLDEEMGRLADVEIGRLEDVKSKEIVEAQGFLKAENGEISLVAQAPTATPEAITSQTACVRASQK